MAKQANALIRWAESQGWECRVTGGNHLKFTKYGDFVFTGSTPGDNRAVKNGMAAMRRKDRQRAEAEAEANVS